MDGPARCVLDQCSDYHQVLHTGPLIVVPLGDGAGRASVSGPVYSDPQASSQPSGLSSQSHASLEFSARVARRACGYMLCLLGLVRPCRMSRRHAGPGRT